MWIPAVFLWIVSSLGYLLWDPIVGFLAFLAGPLVIAVALWPAWLGPLWASLGLATPPWVKNLQRIPRPAALTAAWLWAVGWTFAMPNPTVLLVAEVIPDVRGVVGVSLLVEFTRWAMNHPRAAFPLFLLSGWVVALLWSLQAGRPDEHTVAPALPEHRSA